MPSSQDSVSQPKRPPLLARQSSTSSAVSQSPSDPPLHRPTHHKPHKHVVGGGHGRLGARNTSVGKSLNKLNKQQAHPPDPSSASAKHHRRSLSGNSTPSSSPRPGVKRNASSMGIMRAATHPHLRKNHSSGHLPRQGSSKNALKATKSEVAPPKRSLMKPGKQRHHQHTHHRNHHDHDDEIDHNHSPDDHPTVRFDIGDDENHEDAWTEESASQSPNTTRSTTRQNSVVIDPNHLPQSAAAAQAAAQATAAEMTQDVAAAAATTSTNTMSATTTPPPQEDTTSQGSSTHDHSRPQMQTPPRIAARDQSDQSLAAHQINGSSSYKTSRPPDADIITSRLLRRSGSHHIQPQMSSVSATVVSEAHEPRVLSHSQGSTLAETPGRDLVSRFMDGEASSGTPRESSFLPARTSTSDATSTKNNNTNDQRPQSKASTSGGLNLAHRNKSAPNMALQNQSSLLLHSRSSSRRSGTNSPTTAAAAAAEPPPSRTQQKLWLQRASSNIEPQKLIPVILPRASGPQQAQQHPQQQTQQQQQQLLLMGGGPGVNAGVTPSGANALYASASAAGLVAMGEGGRLDPRLQRQVEQIGAEYGGVRRFRDPIGEAVRRVARMKGGKGKGKNGFVSGSRAGLRKGGVEGSQLSQASGLSQSQSQLTLTSQSQSQSTSQLQSQLQSQEGYEGDVGDGDEGRGSFESDGIGGGGRVFRTEAEELCRRLWESTEVPERED